MQIHHYHPATLEYVGTSTADPDPLDTGKWLVPRHATTVQPPTAGQNQAAIWTENAWEVQPDFRGNVYYDNEHRDGLKISEVGPAPEGMVLVAPPSTFHYLEGGVWVLNEEEELAQWRATADCSAAQAEVIIEQMGLSSYVETIKNDPATPITVKAALKKAYRWSRRSPAWDFVGPALSMTPEQIDDLFVAAQQIEV